MKTFGPYFRKIEYEQIECSCRTMVTGCMATGTTSWDHWLVVGYFDIRWEENAHDPDDGKSRWFNPCSRRLPTTKSVNSS